MQKLDEYLSSEQKQIESIKALLDQENNSIQEIKDQNAKNEANIKANEQSIANINHEIESANSQLVDKSASSEELKAKLKVLGSEEAMIQKEIENETAKLIEAKKIMDMYANECNEQKAMLDKQSNDKMQISNQMKTLEMEALGKDKALINLKKEIGALKAKKECYETEYPNLISEIEALQKHSENLQQQNEKLKEELEKMVELNEKIINDLNRKDRILNIKKKNEEKLSNSLMKLQKY